MVCALCRRAHSILVTSTSSRAAAAAAHHRQQQQSSAQHSPPTRRQRRSTRHDGEISWLSTRQSDGRSLPSLNGVSCCLESSTQCTRSFNSSRVYTVGGSARIVDSLRFRAIQNSGVKIWALIEKLAVRMWLLPLTSQHCSMAGRIGIRDWCSASCRPSGRCSGSAGLVPCKVRECVFIVMCSTLPSSSHSQKKWNYIRESSKNHTQSLLTIKIDLATLKNISERECMKSNLQYPTP